VPAGKLLKIDAEILDLRTQLTKTPKDKSIQERIDALLKERDAQIILIQKQTETGTRANED
jgi:hypothetical protein